MKYIIFDERGWQAISIRQMEPGMMCTAPFTTHLLHRVTSLLILGDWGVCARERILPSHFIYRH